MAFQEAGYSFGNGKRGFLAAGAAESTQRAGSDPCSISVDLQALQFKSFKNTCSCKPAAGGVIRPGGGQLAASVIVSVVAPGGDSVFPMRTPFLGDQSKAGGDSIFLFRIFFVETGNPPGGRTNTHKHTCISWCSM